jgi:hypothetical protein
MAYSLFGGNGNYRNSAICARLADGFSERSLALGSTGGFIAHLSFFRRFLVREKGSFLEPRANACLNALYRLYCECGGLKGVDPFEDTESSCID